MYISIIGAGEGPVDLMERAEELGRLAAEGGHTVVCGGLGGVMDRAAKGAREAGGLTVGILPDGDRSRAGRWLTVSIPTGMGQARNALVALAGDAVIAVGGGYGTLSEIGFALKAGRPVIGLETWRLGGAGGRASRPDVIRASSPAEAIEMAERSGVTA